MEFKKLQERYKNKSDKLIKANKEILELKSILNKNSLWEHEKNTNYNVLIDLTNHLDKNLYYIKYKYDGNTYTEPVIPSFGARWLSEALVIFLAKKRKLFIYPGEIEIIEAKKLW